MRWRGPFCPALKSDRRMGDRIWTRFMTARGDDQVWAYRAAAEAFQAAGTGPLAGELAEAVGALERAILPGAQI